MSSRKKILLSVFILLLLAGALILFLTFGPNTGSMRDGEYLYIRTGASYDEVKRTLEEKDIVRSIGTFHLLARMANYPSQVKAGKYRINRGMSNYNMVRMLRAGKQEPVKLVINKLRTKQDFIRLISANLEADSVQMKKLLADSVYLAQFNLDTNTAMCVVIPDTYEFWWNTGADKVLRKFEKYYLLFWNTERKQKAISKNLTPQQAIILASIIEEETNHNPEKPLMASVYLNRLKRGMKLQADPTVKFAHGDFTIKRINSALASKASPYNTYYRMGLPPGPICTPSKKTIDAVLNAPETSFIFFSAKEDFSGTHRFATTYKEHQQNAKLYQRALDERGIH